MLALMYRVCGALLLIAVTIRARDEQLLRALIARSDAGWERRDASAATSDYARDAELVLPSGLLLRGREAIFEAQRQMLRSATPIEKPRPPHDEIRFVTSDVATISRTFDGGAYRGHSLRVVVKRGGAWQIFAEQIMLEAK